MVLALAKNIASADCRQQRWRRCQINAASVNIAYRPWHDDLSPQLKAPAFLATNDFECSRAVFRFSAGLTPCGRNAARARNFLRMGQRQTPTRQRRCRLRQRRRLSSTGGPIRLAQRLKSFVLDLQGEQARRPIRRRVPISWGTCSVPLKMKC